MENDVHQQMAQDIYDELFGFLLGITRRTDSVDSQARDITQRILKHVEQRDDVGEVVDKDEKIRVYSEIIKLRTGALRDYEKLTERLSEDLIEARSAAKYLADELENATEESYYWGDKWPWLENK